MSEESTTTKTSSKEVLNKRLPNGVKIRVRPDGIRVGEKEYDANFQGVKPIFCRIKKNSRGGMNLICNEEG